MGPDEIEDAEFARSMLRDSTITLADGRRPAYAAWGDPNGRPIFFFHGTPHSRLFCPDEPASVKAGVRVITVDRPGVNPGPPTNFRVQNRRSRVWPGNSQPHDRFGKEV